ncbi:Dam family site-specific DNA-(adenine-N6)-methyltransferase [Mycoplasmopsis verecunda]|uniref:Site-specific DNA-methyltransferase (adenine-specific) n=1 Tax=Mycoplasmopsis verecunda TaxID=171291 RepID=A0A1T4L659_9BACT|nr:Dam family site-specific DNA-(adenine-N6)-methyltransferase [Mycoplasmopsis verecunda]WPB54787.1 Dam family site-specific DNA-(adenine-N6)-methyltransferase [Mycoplasmopsis verecunda]SJZ50182.1 DNA adenine methylase [Mycoplasmopsis verecunda]
MIQKQIGENIKKQRKILNMSQELFADIVNIDRAQISKIESGKINMTIDTLHRISKALGTKLSDLVSISEDFILPKPFVKWAGGKTQVLNEILKLVPKDFNTYYEPFIGGGALLFSLLPKKAVIGDINKHLIASYKCFNDSNSMINLIKLLHNHQNKHSEEYFYLIREQDREDNFWNKSNEQIAARLIYLNKACFNGLYRENSKGYFNVPSGKKDKVVAYSYDNFNAIRQYFANNKIHIMSGDFEKIISNAKANDFIYLDPPYDVYPDKNGFVNYGKDGFSEKEQRRLADVFKKLDKQGCYVMLSNHNTPLINELYEGHNIKVIKAKRMINSKGSGRGNVEEVIITNY